MNSNYDTLFFITYILKMCEVRDAITLLQFEFVDCKMYNSEYDYCHIFRFNN